MLYLIIALVAVILLLVLGAYLMGGKDKTLKVSQEAMNQVRESNISYNDTEKLSDDDVRKRVKAKMVRKK